VAITDLLARIEGDAAEEASVIMAEAQAEAARILVLSEKTVAAERAIALEAADRAGAETAATLLANARLAARDSLLAEKRAMVERVLERAREALESLDDVAYLDLIATAAAPVVAGGQTLAVAAADAHRLAGLAERLGLEVSAEPADIERGVLLTGDRVRVEVSPASLIADRRDELLSTAADALFGGQD
jgi:vacuolar-type H+-ATPase subunit E/Vma4